VPRVRVEPDGLDLDVRAGETLLEAAWRLGYDWPTICFGQADCMTCHVRVVEGEAAAAAATDDELERMRLKMSQRLQSPTRRLACRLLVTGDGLVVEKKGVQPP
jgi:2Fe-2S ferredoxin